MVEGEDEIHLRQAEGVQGGDEHAVEFLAFLFTEYPRKGVVVDEVVEAPLPEDEVVLVRVDGFVLFASVDDVGVNAVAPGEDVCEELRLFVCVAVGDEGDTGTPLASQFLNGLCIR